MDIVYDDDAARARCGVCDRFVLLGVIGPRWMGWSLLTMSRSDVDHWAKGSLN